MNQFPETTTNGSGEYLAEGMLFHISGYWEISEVKGVKRALVKNRNKVLVGVLTLP